LKAKYKSTVGRIAGDCGGEIISGSGGVLIGSISTDSRDIGADGLFIPLIGENFDGHDFIKGLAEAGKIKSFLTMRDGFGGIADSAGIAAVRCDDTLKALGKIASAHRASFDIPVIGITGTNGKTTTKELLHFMLSLKYRVHKNEKNYNNEIGVPFSLLGLERSHQMAVIEMGMNHSGELERLSAMARPGMALITNVGEGHLEFLGSVENVALAKSEIMHGMEKGSMAVINRDTEYFELLKSRAVQMGLSVKTFGLSNGADVRPADFKLRVDGIGMNIGGSEMGVPLYGLHNVYNVTAAFAAASEYGISAADIAGAIGGFVNVGGRSQILDRGYTVINDTYNANPLSVKYALISARDIFPGRRKIAVLSDMKELGGSSEIFHEDTGREVADNGFDLLLACGEMSGALARGAVRSGMKNENVIRFNDKGEMKSFLLDLVRDGDVVLVKGSRSTGMEDIVKVLAG